MNDTNLTELIDQLNNAQRQLRQYLNNLIDSPPPKRNFNQRYNPLTPREYEILFLKFIGKTDYGVSKYLGNLYGEKAERSMIVFKHQIFNKLNVYSNDELIDAAISLDLIKSIPQSFIERQS